MLWNPLKSGSLYLLISLLGVNYTLCPKQCNDFIIFLLFFSSPLEYQPLSEKSKWDMTSLKINLKFLEMNWEPNTADKDAAWQLYIEMLTRIATQRLQPEHGDERTALESIHRLFGSVQSVMIVRYQRWLRRLASQNIVVNTASTSKTMNWPVGCWTTSIASLMKANARLMQLLLPARLSRLPRRWRKSPATAKARTGSVRKRQR